MAISGQRLSHQLVSRPKFALFMKTSSNAFNSCSGVRLVGPPLHTISRFASPSNLLNRKPVCSSIVSPHPLMAAWASASHSSNGSTPLYFRSFLSLYGSTVTFLRVRRSNSAPWSSQCFYSCASSALRFAISSVSSMVELRLVCGKEREKNDT